MKIATLELEPGKFYRRKGWAKERKNNHFGKTDTVYYIHAMGLVDGNLAYVSVYWTYYVTYKVGTPYVTLLRTDYYSPYSISHNSLISDDWEQIELSEKFALKGGLKLPEVSTTLRFDTRIQPLHPMDNTVIR